MAHTLDVTVVVSPRLRAAFDGRLEVSLGLPSSANVGDVLEALLTLYPRLRQHLAGDRPPTGGHFLQLALEEHPGQEWAAGAPGLSAGRRLYLFSLSRPLPGGQSGLEG